jgi:hypothetical protein
MIQLNELRIKNFVLTPTGIKQIEYFVKDICNFENREAWSCDAVKSIPLTDEWKIKFGGVKKGVEWQFKIGEFTTCFEETPEGFFYTGGEGVSLSRNIEFVHDFQNIVYAIEGIEVQINQSAK